MIRAILCASFVLTVLVTRPARCEAPQIAVSGIIPPIIMTASWYGIPFHGRKMADGTIFNMNDSAIVAHKYLALGTQLLICNGLICVQSEVRDRGPFIKGRDLDLSRAAARVLGIEKRGIARVRVWIFPKELS
jgi:rare lipoprotein A